MSLHGRTAVVTGAGQGLGRGIALALADQGANVVVAARRAETGEPVAAEIAGRGGTALCVPTDVTRRDQVDAAMARAAEAFGGLDVVVHNAFTARAREPHRLEEVDDDLWRDMSASAVWASLHCAQAALPHLRSGRGRLVLVTSAAGIEASANVPLYAAVKGAQRALAKSLAREWGPRGITVNCIAPVAETPALTEAFRESPELRRRVVNRTPLARMGHPESDIGPVVAFLAGDGAGWITGQTIVCDGGSFTGL